ncbi:Putative aminoglycoside phosphotransferase [Paraburkholderia domus]|uniref:Aminoglycoside phosphotransferase n=1 Tax=Paraburkholderia domus TaxID=2793075 RepID=A0A9N8QZR3_9BURK|nr:phosphotransferase [Paraburkholderia domus]MBK5049826.1 phosphotransferase [Burkholderia sp. R-70006]MBK5060001.1 phosphotransferase [Burkholderia sp. R-70199]MBK5087406.1 phosphotransferase [Burkholderia sp. R-69927]MBK5125825.1 phosphotransferase [Burkholderia sp. R-69980]MBK5167465.1 phosphotransferase [Burkholderia sp. R-70211]MBK5181165.1 phosphotransferase [Burkholderia sp. R-69749]MCI0146025.1 phosphotransferase [Paraburkholderia sediminicola]
MVQATQTGEPEHKPDYSAFEGTRPVNERQRFDSDALAAWLAQHVDGFSGPLTLEQFAGGQSNPTFKLVTPSRSYVMRAKPGPAAKLLPSAHAVEREYRVMHALADTDVPVANMLALCDDESVIGRAFYVMEFVEGRVLWDQSLPGMTPAERTAIYDEMNRVIAALHSVDVTAIGLADYGKPGNYFARQIGRWSKQYIASETEPIDAMQRLIEWLPQHMPAETGERASVVHGDYRLDNLIFHPNEPRVLAVLDWELSTLGDPLADFAYHCMAWHVDPAQFRGIAGLDWAALGIPDEAQYVERYCKRTGFEIHGDWNFYLAYNMFRIAAILQGIMKRVVDGTAASAQALDAGRRAKPMAELAWRYAQKVR